MVLQRSDTLARQEHMLTGAPANGWAFDGDPCSVMGQWRKFGLACQQTIMLFRGMEYRDIGIQDSNSAEYAIEEEDGDCCPHIAMQFRWSVDVNKPDKQRK